MRPLVVVCPAPTLGVCLHFRQIAERFPLQQLASQAAVERLRVAVLYLSLATSTHESLANGLGDEFRAVVAPPPKSASNPPPAPYAPACTHPQLTATSAAAHLPLGRE